MAKQQDVEPDKTATESSSNGEPTESNNTTESAPEQKSNKLKALWIKLDLDLPTVLMMFKASLPPTIAIAMYQSQAIAGVYSTLGYLIAITSVMGMCIMPRGVRSLREARTQCIRRWLTFLNKDVCSDNVGCLFDDTHDIEMVLTRC